MASIYKPEGYPVDYSYIGKRLDGHWQRYVSEDEYLNQYKEDWLEKEAKDQEYDLMLREEG